MNLSPQDQIIVELGYLAVGLGEEIAADRLRLIASDLLDLPVEDICGAIRCWRKGTLKLANPDDMRRFPTAYQLRAWVTRPRLRYLNAPQERVNPE